MSIAFGNFSVLRDIAVNSNAAIAISQASTTVNLNGQLSGLAELSKSGPGVLRLNRQFSFAGPIRLAGGMMRIGPDAGQLSTAPLRSTLTPANDIAGLLRSGNNNSARNT